jgi:hypothetical protein
LNIAGICAVSYGVSVENVRYDSREATHEELTSGVEVKIQRLFNTSSYQFPPPPLLEKKYHIY